MRMSKNQIILNSTNLIETRDKLSKDISSYWKIIERMNLMTFADAKKYRTYDLKSLYNTITQKANARIKSKLLLNAINSGQTTFDTKDYENSHYYTIYALNEFNEQKTHLGIIMSKHTINPAAKAKAGKKNNKSEIFSYAKLNSMINKLDIKIEALKMKIIEFNKNAKITISTDDDTFMQEFSA